MTEDVGEQFAFWLEPGVDAPEELAVVAHVFEHLHRHHPVIAIVGFEGVDVFGDDLEVVQSPFPGLPLDMLALGMRIGNGSDSGLRVPFRHSEGKGTPSASQFEDRLAVFQPGMFAGQFEGPVFRRRQIADEFIKVTTAVLEVFSQDQPVELSRDFVVLLVGFVRKHGHGRGIGFLDIFFGQFGIGLAVIRQALPESFAAEVADARPDEEIRNQAAFGKFNEGIGQAHESVFLFLGIQGKKEEVRSR